MKKVLFVDCCIRREHSRSKQLADFFLGELQKKGEYEIETLCLMDENLSYFSEGFFLQREALLAEGLIEGENGAYGLYVKKVNGIVADYDIDKTYWAFYINGEYAMSGVDTTEIVEGATYSFKVEK